MNFFLTIACVNQEVIKSYHPAPSCGLFQKHVEVRMKNVLQGGGAEEGGEGRHPHCNSVASCQITECNRYKCVVHQDILFWLLITLRFFREQCPPNFFSWLDILTTKLLYQQQPYSVSTCVYSNPQTHLYTSSCNVWLLKITLLIRIAHFYVLHTFGESHTCQCLIQDICALMELVTDQTRLK